MLSEIEVTNFQSLGHIKVELRPFTCIVGPSSSGKSAFTRAVKTLTSNQRGDSFVTHGENQTVIKARTDRGTVALLRGKKNEYTIIPEDDSSQQKTFTKLAGNTPEEVSAFIGIPAKDALNYSNQFDMPYLLTASPGEVARTLGELTNVHIIFEASREANRRRHSANSTLKTRASDYEKLTINLDKYRSLKAHKEAIERAEQALGEAKELQTRFLRLGELLASIKDIPEVPEAPSFDLAGLQEQFAQMRRITALIDQVTSLAKTIKRANEEEQAHRQTAQQAQQEYTEVLIKAGTCPTCNQTTTHIHT